MSEQQSKPTSEKLKWFEEPKTLAKTANGIIGASFLILIIFLISLWWDFCIFCGETLDMTSTGQVGDFIGGLIGTLVAIGGALLLYATIRIQVHFNEAQLKFNSQTESRTGRAEFEAHLYRLIDLHRLNVTETKVSPLGQNSTYEFRQQKAFQVMIKEFIECYNQCILFLKNVEDIELTEDYKAKIQTVLNENKINVTPQDIARIDLAYSIFFYGVAQEGKRIIDDRYSKLFQNNSYKSLINFLALKPQANNGKNELTQATNLAELTNRTESDLYGILKHMFGIERKDNYKTMLDKNLNLKALSESLLAVKQYTVYYGGHQHRLSHFFRHLYQTYKYLDSSSTHDDDEKYQYARIIRSQLSTYEQQLLFINAISHMGWAWEYDRGSENGLFYKYNPIKNIPNEEINNIAPDDFFPMRGEFQKKK